ncbi:MAG: hypothetical protein R3F59_27005 [Myxococcota bacterium]
MSALALLLSVPALVTALLLPAAARPSAPRVDHRHLAWRSGPVRRERLQWWSVLAVGAAIAATVLALLVADASAVEWAHGFGPHAHFALTRDGVLVTEPVGYQLWALLPPIAWLLPIPLLAWAALAVPALALQARWRLEARADGLVVRRAWPWRSRAIAWSDVTEVYAAGATLHLETRGGALALRADGGELDVAAPAELHRLRRAARAAVG